MGRPLVGAQKLKCAVSAACRLFGLARGWGDRILADRLDSAGADVPIEAEKREVNAQPNYRSRSEPGPAPGKARGATSVAVATTGSLGNGAFGSAPRGCVPKGSTGS